MDDVETLLAEELGEYRSAHTSSHRQKIGRTSPPSHGIVEFGEDAYLEAYPDIVDAIASGKVVSAYEHYLTDGKLEGRLAQEGYLRALAGGVMERPAHGATNVTIDAALLSPSGTFFIVGWTDDRQNPILSLSVIHGGNEGANTRGVGRCRRPDAEAALQAPPGFLFGFWAVIKIEGFDGATGITMVRTRFADGSFGQSQYQTRLVSDFELREIVLGHFATLEYFGNRDIESADALERGAGRALIALNRTISSEITRNSHVDRYGPRRSRFKASLIICLYGKHEFFFLQNAQFYSGVGVEEYEFIYVSNSPELTEVLHKEAKIAERVYGLSITLVTLTGNAGFSAANNIAASFASSDRVVFVNPDVFPRDNFWARAHAEILETRPREQTAMFGAPLYYDDGSLMHGGMHFEIDQGISVKPGEIRSRGMVRVEHYGKGAPEWSDRYTRPRPVPAITGALISADRAWFEKLGGFSQDYLFGHYEDADLCLKSLSRGIPVWMHDVRFWHLEGKGSVRRPPHEGGSLVNRWWFTRNWGGLIEASLAGRLPSHPLLNGEPPTSLDTALAWTTPVPPKKPFKDRASLSLMQTESRHPARPSETTEPEAPAASKPKRMLRLPKDRKGD